MGGGAMIGWVGGAVVLGFVGGTFFGFWLALRTAKDGSVVRLMEERVRRAAQSEPVVVEQPPTMSASYADPDSRTYIFECDFEKGTIWDFTDYGEGFDRLEDVE